MKVGIRIDVAACSFGVCGSRGWPGREKRVRKKKREGEGWKTVCECGWGQMGERGERRHGEMAKTKFQDFAFKSASSRSKEKSPKKPLVYFARSLQIRGGAKFNVLKLRSKHHRRTLSVFNLPTTES